MGDLKMQHKFFLQAFMWKKICYYDEVLILHKKCHDSAKEQIGDLKIFIDKINAALNPMNMALKKGYDEITGKSCYVLTNGADTPISRLSLEFKRQDLELLKRIISSIVESDEGKVSSTTILNFADDVKISRRDANEIVQRFEENGWLCNKDGYVFFSTRAIVELQHFFKENYPNSVLTCYLCKSIVFQGPCCETCGKKFHNHCTTTYFSQVGTKICPACKKTFSYV